MVVRPYRLRCWEGEVRLAFGFDGLRTMHRFLFVFHKVKVIAEREKLISRMRAVELFPYYVVNENRCVFAEDCIEADLSSRPCDPWYVLNHLPDSELADQCRMIWKKSVMDKECAMRRFVDPVYQRLYRHGPGTKKWKDPYTKSSRALMVAQLRLAMFLPFIPSQSLAHKNTLDAVKRRENEVDAAARNKFRELHVDNIGSRLVEDLLIVVGPELEWYNKGVRRDVVKFCRSYGYDPDEMTWMQVLALWNEGVPGYRMACVRGEYSKYAKF